MLYAHPSMDQAKEILSFIQAKLPNKGYVVNGMGEGDTYNHSIPSST